MKIFTKQAHQGRVFDDIRAMALAGFNVGLGNTSAPAMDALHSFRGHEKAFGLGHANKSHHA